MTAYIEYTLKFNDTVIERQEKGLALLKYLFLRQEMYQCKIEELSLSFIICKMMGQIIFKLP